MNQTSIEQLNQKFAIKDTFSFSTNQTSFTKVKIKSKSGYSLELYLYGAHITSWKDPKNQELFFMSEKAVFEQGKPIRGGIPLVFPQFGGGALPSHGFARIKNWQVESAKLNAQGHPCLKLYLESNSEIKNIWPYDFKLDLDITLSDKLSIDFTVNNLSDKIFEFTSALHTYFAVSDVRKIQIEGLAGLEYLDSLKNREKFSEKSKIFSFEEQIDRIYLNAPNKMRIITPERKFVIEKTNYKDAVVWNPWAERAKQIADLGDNEWPNLACVEAGNVAAPINLAGKSKATFNQTLSIEQN